MAIQQGSNVTVTHQIVINEQVAFEANDIVNVESISPNPQSTQHKYTVFSTRLNQRFSLSDSDVREATVPVLTPPVAPPYPPVRSGRSGKTTGDHWRELPNVAKVMLVLGIIVVFAIIVGVAVTAVKNETPNTETPSLEQPAETPAETPAPEPTAAPAPTPAPTPVNSPKMSMAEFNAIQNGMTYEQVVQIVGGPGEKMSEVGSPGEEFYTVMYTWDGEGTLGANANCMFQAGAMSMKAQFGLE